MNKLEAAIEKGEQQIEWYLGEVSVASFMSDLNEIKAKAADKGAIRQAIISLNALL